MEPLRPLRGTVITRVSRGVTLIELVIVLAIIGVLSGLFVTSQTTFNKTILLTNTAYDVALTIRDAQTFGLGSRVSLKALELDSKTAGYGVHFMPDTASFELFADVTPVNSTSCHPAPLTGPGSPSAVPGDCVYQVEELVQSYLLGNGMKIADNGICVFSSEWDCGLSSLDIVFARPNTKTFFSADGTYSNSLTRAQIIVTSPQGGQRYVCVQLSGEVYVSSSACL